MTELKTLKDIEEECADEDYDWDKKRIPPLLATINKADLRQEAIKWIKEFRQYDKEIYIGDNKQGGQSYIINKLVRIHKNSDVMIGDRTTYSLECWIMHFFNITEEELK